MEVLCRNVWRYRDLPEFVDRPGLVCFDAQCLPEFLGHGASKDDVFCRLIMNTALSTIRFFTKFVLH